MKTTTTRLMIATAALAVAACSASAQTLRAEIPMSFRAAGKVMAPGTYEIRQTNASPAYIHVYNTETHAAVTLVPGTKSDAPKTWLRDGGPRIAFECLGDSCTLRRLWNGQGTETSDFPAPKPNGNIEARQMTVITLAMTKVH